MPRTTIFRSKTWLTLALVGAAAGPLSAAVAQAAAKPATYKVKPGDTLFSIARQLLGDQSLWVQLYRLNADVIDDPGHIRPGQVLKVAGAADAKAVAGPETPAPEQPAAKPAPANVEAPARPAAAAKPEVEARSAEAPAKAEPKPEMTMPTPQPMRPGVVVEPADDQAPAGTDSTFMRRRGMDARAALRTYREQPYRPLRRGEFFAAGFLTEGDKLPFGRLLGTVTPQQIRNLSDRSTATLYTEVAVQAPAGASYAVGDSVMIVQLTPGPEGYGDIVVPTGMARVTGQNGKETLASVVAVFGPIRNGQYTIPAEKFVDGGTTRAQPVEKGVVGAVLAQREPRELKHPQNYLFIDKGRKDGVARGDIFEVRRDPAPRIGASSTVDELMAVLQVIHVRDRTATVKVINVILPDIAPGTRAVQVAKLPN